MDDVGKTTFGIDYLNPGLIARHDHLAFALFVIIIRLKERL